MMTMSLAVISDRLQALTRQLDGDPVLPGRLLVYDGQRPVSGGTPDGCNLLATVVFNRPSLDNVTGKTLTLLQPNTVLVQWSGLATWARMVNGVGQFVADMDAGVDPATCEVVIRKVSGLPADTAQLYAGGELSITVAQLVEP